MIPTPSSRQDSRHSISFLLSRPESPSFQEAEPTRSTSSLSWASTATATEDAPSPFLSSRSTTIEPPSPAAWDVSTFVPPRPNSGASTPQTKYLTPPTSRERSDVRSLSLSTTSLKPAPQHLIKGKARAVLTPLLIGRHEGNSPCHPCLPNSILRSHEPWVSISTLFSSLPKLS
ncbi:hypothetical protein ARMGADRAFT_177787 [Armillaria gallica]|uniref:Uncharacterized protein n=1 Tax=Armillaria gallica TaxID=47427 RepID=A0A2H3DA68_ARMGA|nr:hypothetical protein ARMGADRAFT_177787 [Armillaria gallica]